MNLMETIQAFEETAVRAAESVRTDSADALEDVRTHEISTRALVCFYAAQVRPRCSRCGALISFESFLGAWIHDGDEPEDEHNVE